MAQKYSRAKAADLCRMGIIHKNQELLVQGYLSLSLLYPNNAVVRNLLKNCIHPIALEMPYTATVAEPTSVRSLLLLIASQFNNSTETFGLIGNALAEPSLDRVAEVCTAVRDNLRAANDPEKTRMALEQLMSTLNLPLVKAVLGGKWGVAPLGFMGQTAHLDDDPGRFALGARLQNLFTDLTLARTEARKH